MLSKQILHQHSVCLARHSVCTSFACPHFLQWKHLDPGCGYSGICQNTSYDGNWSHSFLSVPNLSHTISFLWHQTIEVLVSDCNILYYWSFNPYVAVESQRTPNSSRDCETFNAPYVSQHWYPRGNGTRSHCKLVMSE